MTTRNLSLSKRRLAVVLSCLSYPVIFVFAFGHFDTWLKGIISVICALFFLATSFYLYWKTGLWQLGNSPDEQLDERQVQTRNQAYRFAYSILGTIFLLGGVYLELAIDKGLWLPQAGGQTTAFAMIVIFIALSLPSLVLAWTEKEI